jgi:hypothetical protein
MNPQQMMMEQMPPQEMPQEPSLEEQEVARSCEACEYWVPDEDPARGGECTKVQDSEAFMLEGEAMLLTQPDFSCSEFEAAGEEAAEEIATPVNGQASPDAVRAILERLMNAKKVG